ncbi:MAG: hypothetical protein V9E93_02635 [Steroidobacteraceae bacterium]|nr:hypothetical protein [Pseudomonadota bacterium]MBP6106273.1 hypothetical protein [Steroidobacteraceae bacterium]MBP7012202.1 hypothetical protein [Steroidobacteraceae bacterium]
MTGSAAYLLALAVTFVIHGPFGYWRAGVRKLSPRTSAASSPAAGCA